MTTNQKNAINAMRTAWQKARQYAADNGGKPSQYFIFSLREAWEEIKSAANTNSNYVIQVTTVLGNETTIDLVNQTVNVHGECINYTGWKRALIDKKDRKLYVCLQAKYKGNDVYIGLNEESGNLFCQKNEELGQELYKKKKAEEDRKARTQISVYLSSRGWGDYSPVEWRGDVNTPDADIIAQCKQLLTSSHDVDNRNQSDDEIADKISKAKAEWHEKQEQRKIAKKQAQQVVDTVSPRVKAAYAECKGNPDALHDDIDHPLYFAVKKYAEALSMISIND